MRYAGIIKNDISAAPGICLTFFTQGCSHHCPGCHNPDTWDFNGGGEFTQEVMQSVLDGIKANGILRNFCVMGGEPLDPQNELLTYTLISEVKKTYPTIKIYIWTGYILEDLLNRKDPKLTSILELTDCLVDGPFIQELRDITLPMRGSSNQRIINLREIDFNKN